MFSLPVMCASGWFVKSGGAEVDCSHFTRRVSEFSLYSVLMTTNEMEIRTDREHDD